MFVWFSSLFSCTRNSHTRNIVCSICIFTPITIEFADCVVSNLMCYGLRSVFVQLYCLFVRSKCSTQFLCCSTNVRPVTYLCCIGRAFFSLCLSLAFGFFFRNPQNYGKFTKDANVGIDKLLSLWIINTCE